MAAAAQTDGKYIWHPEVGAHTAHLNRHGRLPRETFVQRSNIGRRAANIDNDGIGHPRQERRSAHRIGRARGKGQHWKAFGIGRIHQGAVVLRQIEPTGDASFGDGLTEGVNHMSRQIAQAGVHDRGIFAL